MLLEALLVAVAVFLGGLVKGFSGFGYAVIGVGLLSFQYPSHEAVIIMIAPLLIANLSLTRSMSRENLDSCMDSFSYFMMALVTGVTAGMFVIGRLPGNLLANAVGVLILVYALSKMDLFGEHFSRIRKTCFKRDRRLQTVLGVLTGVVFGASSIGAPVVGYIDSLDLDEELFVGLLAFIFLVISSVRIALSWLLGYYSGNDLLYISLLAGLPGLIGVKIGSRLSGQSDRIHEYLVIALFFVIGLRLLVL